MKEHTVSGPSQGSQSTEQSVAVGLLCSRGHSKDSLDLENLCCCSVARLCPTLCNPMDCTMASLSFTIFQSLLKVMSVESVMPSNHLILCLPLLLLPSIFHSIRVFPSESALCLRWPEYWSFSFSLSPFSESSGLISLLSRGLSRVFSSTTIQKHQFFGIQPSLWSNSHICT